MRKNIAEEYLETILYLTRDGQRAKTRDIAQAMGIKPPSVSEMLLKLRDEGLIDYAPYEGAVLTEPGRKQALLIERKHQLLETFLVDTLGVEVDAAHDEACEMEHTISENTVEKICAYLGHPRYCPDAHVIPKGPCCEKVDACKPLSEMKEGDEAIIKIVTVDSSTKDYLLSLGFLPDVLISIKKKLPSNSLLIRVKGSEIAIGKDIARKIMVTKVVS
jgi:DtxR family transcriptional regulator, Mn-dependent transcriptional regulator